MQAVFTDFVFPSVIENRQPNGKPPEAKFPATVTETS
jgi:hypothetical protein